ncbi:MAG: hypothetical protein HY819_12970 [Acidobacteria bacterium]|nr:hypothetical protein [Acidobacteriota bacterium]
MRKEAKNNLDNCENFSNLDSLNIEEKELKTILSSWKTLKPSPALDKKVLSAFHKKQKESFFYKFIHSSIKVPLPIAASILVLFLITIWFSIANQTSNLNNNINYISKEIIETRQNQYTKISEENNNMLSNNRNIISKHISKEIITITKNKKNYSQLRKSNSNKSKNNIQTDSSNVFRLQRPYLLASNFEKQLVPLSNSWLEQTLSLDELESNYKKPSKYHPHISLNKQANCNNNLVFPVMENYNYYVPLSISNIEKYPVKLILNINNKSVQ